MLSNCHRDGWQNPQILPSNGGGDAVATWQAMAAAICVAAMADTAEMAKSNQKRH